MCLRESIEFRERRVTPGEDLDEVKSRQKSTEAVKINPKIWS